MSRSTERVIQLLRSVNAEAVNNDQGKPGQFLAELCNEAADKLETLADVCKRNVIRDKQGQLVI